MKKTISKYILKIFGFAILFLRNYIMKATFPDEALQEC
ncbi:hypothetical protein STRDD11_00901 [Streptococcus sp. DD11]|nr:hypothetical protein STRDD11_00901 [Streptococcus sp. DD11]